MTLKASGVCGALLGAVIALGAGGLPAAAQQGTIFLPGRIALNAPVKSYAELRFANIVRQGYDQSCGAAAMATLLRYYFGIEATEKQVIEAILEQAAPADREKIQSSGFSLLELKRYAERLGFAAGGFKVADVRNLEKLKAPAIALTSVRGYNHFVVVKGVRDGAVHIADPAFGNRVRTLRQFADEWGQVLLVIVDQKRQPRSEFVFDAQRTTPTRELVTVLDTRVIGVGRGAGEF